MYKRTLNRILFGWIFLMILVALLGKVTVAAPDGGRTAADFLNIGIGARSAGMGGAYTAVAEGAGAAYWNPAGLHSVEAGEVILGHFAWYQDLTMEHGVVGYTMNDRTTVAATISYLNYGTIDGRNASGAATGDITAYDWYGAASIGYQATPRLAFGLTGKFVNQKLDDLSASTFAADLGVKYDFERVSLAGMVANVGPDMTFEDVSEHLPSLARLGVAATFFNEQLLTSVELEKKFYGATVIRHGVEFAYDNQYFVRTGYNYYPSQEERTFGNGWSFGAGVRVQQFEFDYAYTLGGHYTSDDLHRFSLVLKFGQ